LGWGLWKSGGVVFPSGMPAVSGAGGSLIYLATFLNKYFWPLSGQPTPVTPTNLARN